MCIPHADNSAQAPVAVQSLQSASALDLGGAPRGAAQLGRLKLRLGGTAAQAPASTPLANALALPSGVSGSVAATGGSSTGAGGSDYASGAFSRSPNENLRLPA